jgi:hypothetical protein
MRPLIALILALSVRFSASVAVPETQSSLWEIGQDVRTTSGTVKGHVAAWPEYTDVSEYLGIPYAQPPVGPLRWLAAKPFKSDKLFTADKYVCIRYIVILCASLNICSLRKLLATGEILCD